MTVVERDKFLKNLAQEYTEQGYEVLAIDQEYPGIFTEESEEIKGRVDLLMNSPEEQNTLLAVETSHIGSISPDVIEERYVEQAEQLQKHISYFEDLGYEVVPEADLKPQGKLLGLKNFWKNTTGSTTWEGVVEALGDRQLAGNLKGEGIIIFDGLTNMGSELYTVNQEIEEYDELIDMFNQGII